MSMKSEIVSRTVVCAVLVVCSGVINVHAVVINVCAVSGDYPEHKHRKMLLQFLIVFRIWHNAVQLHCTGTVGSLSWLFEIVNSIPHCIAVYIGLVSPLSCTLA